MVRAHGFLVLAILLGSSQRQQVSRALVQAYQDAAHYYLPSNIYDNLPPGLETPAFINTPPVPSSSPTPIATPLPSPLPAWDVRTAALVSDSQSSGSSLSLGSHSVSITTPLLNSVYTPGSGLTMTWSNVDNTFSENWQPPQSILDMITNDPNFSNSPLLTKEDMTNLAKIKLLDLQRSELSTLLKDSPIWLHSLRLVSWPLQQTDSDSETSETSGADDDGGDGEEDEEGGEGELINDDFAQDGDAAATAPPDNTSQQQAALLISPNILSGPGYDLRNVSKLMILGGAGGQLSWSIPEDWEYEGEFEIRIHSVSSVGGESSANKDGNGIGGATVSGGPAKSHSFWILRDAATRTQRPQYNLPPMDQQQYAMSFKPGENGLGRASFAPHGRNLQRKRDLGIFLGVAAMMLAFVLLGIGAMIGIYRRKWAAQSSMSPSSSSFDGPDPSLQLNSCATHLESSGESEKLYSHQCQPQQAQTRLIDPFQPSHGDEDAHSPTDLNLSEQTLYGAVGSSEMMVPMSEKAIAGKGRQEDYSPVDSSFVDLPLYELSVQDTSSSTLDATSSPDSHATKHEVRE